MAILLLRELHSRAGIIEEMATTNAQDVKSSRRQTILWLITLMALVLAYSSVSSPHEERVLGLIAGYVIGDPQIEIVTDVRSVIVRVTTYGDGCYRQGETEAEVQGMEAVVTPHDYILVDEGSGMPCFH